MQEAGFSINSLCTLSEYFIFSPWAIYIQMSGPLDDKQVDGQCDNSI